MSSFYALLVAILVLGCLVLQIEDGFERTSEEIEDLRSLVIQESRATLEIDKSTGEIRLVNVDLDLEWEE